MQPIERVKRVDALTDEQKARMPEWRDKWIEIGLRTGPADRTAFERHVRACYRAAGLPEPKAVVWVASPFVMAFAAPAASLSLEWRKLVARDRAVARALLAGSGPHGAVGSAVRDAVGSAVRGAVHGAVGSAVRDAVGSAVGGAVDDAVRGAVHGAVGGAVDDAVHGAVDDAVHDAVDVAVDSAVRGAVHDAVDGAVHDAVDSAVHDAVDGAVDGAVDSAVRGAVHDAVRGAVDDAVHDAVDGAVDSAVDSAVRGAVDSAVHDAVDGAVDSAVRGAVGGAVDDIRKAVVDAIQRGYAHYFGGQFWVGGWYWGSPSWVSYFREVCGLDLGEEMTTRADAYAGTCESACWWWPHRDFVMACERPVHIHRDARGRLHSTTGPAIVWPDGWGLYRINGREVPRDIIEDRASITVARIDAERNAELRRIMVELYGTERFMRDSGAREIHRDDTGTLYRRDFADGRPMLAVHVINGTVEPDGTRREFWLRPHPELRPLLPDGGLGEPQELTALAAVASTYGLRAEQYRLVART